MRVTIIPEDNRVSIDGRAATIDLAAHRATIHAVQWYGDHGTVERVQGGAVAIGTLEAFQEIIDAARAVFDAEDNHTPTLAEMKAAKHAAIAARFATALEAGMPYGGKVLQIREQDQINITTMGNEARWALATGAAWPSDFAWRMADNSFLPLATPDDCIALGLAAKAEVIRLRRNKWLLDDLVEGAETIAALDAIDIEAGW